MCWEQLSQWLAGLFGGSPTDENDDENDKEEPVNPTPDKRQWTLMLYMAGDNGKEFPTAWGPEQIMAEMTSVGYTDLGELRAAGASDQVAVLAQFDTISENDLSYRFQIKGPDEEPEVLRIDETNCGDPATLRDFIVWGMERCPAEKYLLVLWNHGGGWKEDDIWASYRSLPRSPDRSRAMSQARVRRSVFRKTAGQVLGIEDVETRWICADDSSKDFLDNAELQQALAEAADATGQRLSLIGMDACLMSMLEVAYQIRDHAEVMVGSQEVEPMAGWPYTPILSALTARPQMTPQELSELIVQEYARSYRPSTRRVPEITQSAINLAQMEPLGEKLAAFVAALQAAFAADVFAEVALNRAKQDGFRFDDPDYLDLRDLVEAFQQQYKGQDAAVLEAAQALLDDLTPGPDRPILANVTQGKRYAQRAHGLSIYFPSRGISQFYDGLDFAATGWGELIKLVNRVA